MKVIWSKKSKESITNIYDYIFLRSPQNAENVVRTIIKLADSLGEKDATFSKDLIIDKENIRFFPKWNYKILYKIKEDKIIILDIFDSRQNPSKMKP